MSWRERVTRQWSRAGCVRIRRKKTKVFSGFIPTGQELKVIAKYWMEYDLTERLRASNLDETLDSAMQVHARRRLDEISNLLSGRIIQNLAGELKADYQEMCGEEVWDTLIHGINDQLRLLSRIRRRIFDHFQ